MKNQIAKIQSENFYLNRANEFAKVEHGNTLAITYISGQWQPEVDIINSLFAYENDKTAMAQGAYLIKLCRELNKMN